MAADIGMNGKWKHYKSENLDQLSDALELGFMKKKVAGTLDPVLEITQAGDSFTIKTTQAMKTHEHTWVLNVDGEVDDPSTGKRLKGSPSIEGKKLVLKTSAVDGSGKDMVVYREIVNGELVQTINCGDVVCTRYFKKQ